VKSNFCLHAALILYIICKLTIAQAQPLTVITNTNIDNKISLNQAVEVLIDNTDTLTFEQIQKLKPSSFNKESPTYGLQTLGNIWIRFRLQYTGKIPTDLSIGY
jgi:hypothetical protein